MGYIVSESKHLATDLESQALKQERKLCAKRMIPEALVGLELN